MSFIKKVYIDASEGNKKHSLHSGVCIVHDKKYCAIPIRKCGINCAEMQAYKLALNRITMRPILIVTDSKHVMAHAKSVAETCTVGLYWQKRNSCLEQEIADMFCKLSAKTGMTFQGTFKDIKIQLEKHPNTFWHPLYQELVAKLG